MAASADLDQIRSEILDALPLYHVWAVDFVGGPSDRELSVWLFVESNSDAAGVVSNQNVTEQVRALLADHLLNLEGLHVCSRSRLDHEFAGSRFNATR
jgi:hypothetical protein